MENNNIKPTDKDVVEAFVQDEQYKKNHQAVAQQLHAVYGKKWFTASDLIKKTRIPTIEEAQQLLIGLQLFGLCTAKQGGQLYKNQMKFQLMLTPQDKLKVLEDEKERTEKQLALINQEIEKVESEINLSSTIEE